MGQIPSSPRAEVLSFAEVHNSVWKGHEVAIGLTVAQRAAFEDAINAYATAVNEQKLAKSAATTATQTANVAFAAMQVSLSDAVRTIKTFAQNSANPDTVYDTAQIAPPAPPTPVGPPAQPTDVTVSLDITSGALTLKWKATNPANGAGTSYLIKRRLPGAANFTFIGATGVKSFTDDTFTAGPDSVQYTIQGQRSGSVGPVSSIITVTFGRSGDGAARIDSVRLAA